MKNRRSEIIKGEIRLKLALLGGLVFFVTLVCCGWTREVSQAPLTRRLSNGRQIYLRGTGTYGNEILAYIGESSLEAPGNSMACVNCHGVDGKGKPEGGVVPSNLTSEALTKPYGVTHPDGRKHPPYTERGLELAITRGVDPAGNKLRTWMPRYSMTAGDLSDLILYLDRLGKDADPGISENRVVIGTVVPTRGALAEMGEAVKAVIKAFFEELNGQGGIYNRRFELRITETVGTPEATRSDIERLLASGDIFAMLGGVVAGAEREVFSLMAEKEVPLIGPFTLYPQTSFPINRQVFYLVSGIDGQVRALVDFAARERELKDKRIAIVTSRSEMNAGFFEALSDQAKKDGLGLLQTYNCEPGESDMSHCVEQLIDNRTMGVFFLGSNEQALSLVTRADRLGWFPHIFLLGAGGTREVLGFPSGFNRKVFFAFPTSPAAQTAEGISDFRSLAEKYHLPTHNVAAQMSAYSAAKVLVEAFRRAGKDVSRENLIQTLERLYEYQTGLMPPITFGPNRRIGAMGSYVVTIDLEKRQLVPASGWININ